MSSRVSTLFGRNLSYQQLLTAFYCRAKKGTLAQICSIRTHEITETWWYDFFSPDAYTDEVQHAN